MAKRKGISPSLRWSVFSRDGFTCRYCGARAGQDGVELHADHVLSVIDGGDDSFDNLVTACQKCNGGKGGRSLADAPTSREVIDRLSKSTHNLMEQAEAMSAAIAAQKNLEQMAVNLKCKAFDCKSVDMLAGEHSVIINLCREFGADKVLEWYTLASDRGIYENRAVRYVCGIARNVREKRREQAEEMSC